MSFVEPGSGNSYEQAGLNIHGQDLRIIASYNPASGRAEEALDYISQLELTHDVVRLESTRDAVTNAENLKAALLLDRPSVLCLLMGDGGTKDVINGLYTASLENPEILETPIILQPYGTGNDFALGTNKSKHDDVLHIIENGRPVQYHPIEATITPPGGSPTSHVAAGYIAFGATADIAVEITKPEVHNHPGFKHPIMKHLLLANAALKGFLVSKPFISEEKGPDGEFEPEQMTEERIFFRAMRFAIHGRSKARISDPYIRETIMSRKYSLLFSR